MSSPSSKPTWCCICRARRAFGCTWARLEVRVVGVLDAVLGHLPVDLLGELLGQSLEEGVLVGGSGRHAAIDREQLVGRIAEEVGQDLSASAGCSVSA